MYNFIFFNKHQKWSDWQWSNKCRVWMETSNIYNYWREHNLRKHFTNVRPIAFGHQQYNPPFTPTGKQ